MGFFSLVVVVSAIWMAVDSSQIGYDRRDVQGLAAMTPAGWLITGLLLWIVAFPLYLIKRPELKAAAERRRQGMMGGGLPGQLAGPTYGQPHGQPGYGQPGYGQPGYGQPGYYGQTPSGPAYPPAYPPSPGPAAAPIDVTDEIVKLARLKDTGLLTEAEFQRKKTELLART